MRLLYVMNGFVRGGAELGLLHLARHGFFDDMDARVFCLFAGDRTVLNAVRATGVDVVAGTPADKMTLGAFAAGLPGVIRQISAFQPDAMILSLPQANIVGRLAALAFPRLCVASFEHSSEYSKSVYGPIMKALSGRVDVVLGDCQQTCTLAAERFFRTPPEVRLVVPLAAFDDAVSPVKQDYDIAGPVKLVSVGRLTDAKNHARLIEAVVALNASGLDTELTLIGDGQLMPAMRQKIAALGLGDKVALPGFIADWRARAAEWDMMVMPSVREGLSITTLEAFACGLPVIASDVGGIADYGRDGDNIVTLDATNAPSPEDIAAAVKRVAGDGALRARIGQNGAETVRVLFGTQMVRARLAEVRRALAEATMDKAEGDKAGDGDVR